MIKKVELRRTKQKPVDGRYQLYDSPLGIAGRPALERLEI